MTTKPVDPYNLVGDSFPAEDPVAYLREAIDSLKNSDANTEAAGRTADEAARHEDSEGGLANEMYGAALALTTAGDNAQSVAVLLATRAIMITETQQAMTRFCYEGTLSITRGDAVAPHRTRISGIRRAYEQAISEIERELQRLTVGVGK